MAGLYGLALRAWLLAHLPLFGDEAVVGLVGRGIVHGNDTTFYWGQLYGGVEPYVVAVMLRLVNNGPMGLNLTPAVLALGAALVTYVLCRQALVDRRLAAVSAAAVWIWPYAAVWNSVRELGFRGVTLLCGLVAVACALRIWRKRAGLVTRVVFGLAMGLGWWASPEIVYFAPFVAFVLLGSWARLQRRSHHFARPFDLGSALCVAAGVVVGSLPWLVSNVRTEAGSLRATQVFSGGYNYWSRLGTFFRAVLPTQLGLRLVPGLNWVGWTPLAHVIFSLFLAAIVVCLVVAVGAVRRRRAGIPMMAAGMSVVFFPFLYAEFPSSWYAVDGRYGVYLAPLLVVLFAFALSSASPARLPRHSRRPRASVPVGLVVGMCGLVVMGAFTVTAAGESGVSPTPSAFFSGWHDPNAAARRVVRAMVAHHITRAYGDYWTSYNLDLLAGDHVVVSPSPLDDDSRSAALAQAVAQSPHPAWLFFNPHDLIGAGTAFSNPETGPGGYNERQFTGYLKGTGVSYRIVHLGVLDAVIPAHRVHPPAG